MILSRYIKFRKYIVRISKLFYIILLLVLYPATFLIPGGLKMLNILSKVVYLSMLVSRKFDTPGSMYIEVMVAQICSRHSEHKTARAKHINVGMQRGFYVHAAT